jgi:hypothetical protein
MNKRSDAEDTREPEQDPAPDETIRQLLDDLDEQGGDRDTFNPRTGEDPGALPLTEDPLERRSKRTTM